MSVATANGSQTSTVLEQERRRVDGGSQRQREREKGREGGRGTVFWRDNLFCLSSLVFSLVPTISDEGEKRKKKEDETISLLDSLNFFLSRSLLSCRAH